MVFSAAKEFGKYVLCFRSVEPGNTKRGKKKSGPKTEAHVDIIHLSSIELSLDLKRNGEIRVSDKHKVEHCIRGWNGIIDAENQADAALVDVSRNEFDHDNPGFSLSDSD